MEERRYGINWLSLFIKVIVFVVIVLLAIWLISKITLKDKGLSFEENNKKFQDATVEYFKKNLPEGKNTMIVTLNQLITWDYIEELKNEDGKKCDVKNSNSKIEIVEDYYSIKTVFVCGNKSETTYIKLGNEECTNCDVKVEGLKPTTKEENQTETNKEETNSNISTNTTETSKGSSSTNNQNTNSNQTILYEYVKEVTEYSDWYTGKVTGPNIENDVKRISYSKYCKNEYYTYYTTSYVTSKKSYSYKLELINLDNISSIKLQSNSYFTNYSDYQNYINNKYKDLQMVNENKEYSIVPLPTAREIRNSALTSNNFTYKVSQAYKENGKYYVDITINVKNLNGVVPYYATDIKTNIYYVPIKFTVSYADRDNCVVDKTDNYINYGNYSIISTWTEATDVYRYKITTK